MAHPIRPESYIKMDNFYTVTVYEKGAEVVRLYETLLGKEGFRKGAWGGVRWWARRGSARVRGVGSSPGCVGGFWFRKGGWVEVGWGKDGGLG